jgi:hypothetical protein
MEPTANPHLYMDWSFWAVVVAAIAVLLSQLPPIHLLVRRAKIDVEPYSRIHVTHKVGNPNVQLHLIVTNTGGRNVKLKNFTIAIKRDGKDIAILPAANYLQNPGDKTNVLFTSFSLKPKEEWAHLVNFLNYFPRADEKKYRSAEAQLRADIIEKRKLPENKDVFVEAKDQLVRPFIDMFNEKFVWLPGEYEIAILIKTGNERVNIEKKFRFTLFESDSVELSKAKDDYKIGDGIYWDSGNHVGVIVTIDEA